MSTEELSSLSQYSCLIIQWCVLSLEAQYNKNYVKSSVILAKYLQHFFTIEWILCLQQAALEGVSLFSLQLRSSCTNALVMVFDFCSKKFTRSDIVQSEPVLIHSKCNFFFSLKRNFCSSERKILLSPFICATVATRLPFRQGVNGKKRRPCRQIFVQHGASVK